MPDLGPVIDKRVWAILGPALKEALAAFVRGGRLSAGLLSGTIPTGVQTTISHANLTNLTTGDPHTQYATQTEFDDHNARHEPGGADPMAVDAAATTGSLRTIGTTALAASAGNHTHAGAGHVIEDETVDMTQRGTLNFAGAGVVVTDDAAGDRSTVTISGASGSIITPADNLTLWKLCR